MIVLYVFIYLLVISKQAILPDDYFLAVSKDLNNSTRVEDTIYLRLGEEIIIHPVYRFGDKYYSTTDKIEHKGDEIDTYPINHWMKWRFSEINPICKGYDNMDQSKSGDINSFIEPISYSVKSLQANKIRARGVGTTYIGLNIKEFIELEDGEFTTEGLVHKEFDNRIIQLVIREDDSYIGYLKELMNTPFIYTPKQVNGIHQTDARVGSDCAEFAIYGARRLGYDIPYCGPNGLHEYVDSITEWIYCVERDGRKIYVDQDNIPMVIGEKGILPGDIMHFMEQVSVLYEDRGLIGYLDSEDLLIHSYYNEPCIIAIEDTEFIDAPLRVYRLKNLDN